MAIFPTFFLVNTGKENVLYDILERKNAFRGYENRKFKSRKIDIFPYFMVLVQKRAFFQLLFLGTIGQENVFYDILERKNTFLGYKNKKFKKSKNWHISKGGNSWFWSTNGHFSNDTIRIEYREERLVFFLQSHQTSFVGQICLKRKNKPIWNFWPKPWTNPFGKIQILRLFYIDVFAVKKG